MVNTNLSELPAYLFKDLDERKEALRKDLQSKNQPDDIIALGVGDPDIPTPFPIRKKISDEALKSRGYPDYDGLPELREAVAEHYQQRFGVNLSASNILIADGAKSDIAHMMLAFSNPNKCEKVIIQQPSYPVNTNWATIFGLEQYFIPCHAENNFEGELPKGALDDRLAMVTLINPNNPTGKVNSLEYLSQVVKQTKEANPNAVILHDIAYSDFRPGGDCKPYSPSIFNVQGGKDIGVEIGSFSKRFSMTDDRLSFLAVMNPELMEKAAMVVRSNIDSGVPEYIQWGGVEALTNPLVKEIVNENMVRYGRRAEVIKIGCSLMDFDVYGLDHGFFAWVNVGDRGYDSASFAERALEEAHIIVTPGKGFGDDNYIRLALSQPKDVMEEAMTRMNKINW